MSCNLELMAFIVEFVPNECVILAISYYPFLEKLFNISHTGPGHLFFRIYLTGFLFFLASLPLKH